MAVQQSRYLGVQPFKTSDKHLFFGRDEDIENLHDTILLEKLIVLFGKSGYGKSSLLNAGIVPRLTAAEQPPSERFRPIEVRFTSFAVGQSVSPMDTMQFLLKDVPLTEGGVFLKKTDYADTLWGQFKQRQGVENGQFVLIFDQFEEFFSYPTEQQDVFKRQLSELLYTDIPQAVRAKMGEFSEAERRYLATPMHIKAVFAIREDRMSFLDSMKDALPAILHKRYKLAPLSIEQAKQAITQPAVMDGDFLSEKFEYTEGGLAAIVKALTTATVDGKTVTTTGVEAFQLQIVCEYIESLVKEGKVPDRDGNGLPDITEAELPQMAQLYAEYYYRKLQELNPALKNAAQIALEDGLLTEDPATGEGRRMSVDSRALMAQFRHTGLTDAVLMALEKTYLIRREVNTVGGFSFEISHDTLVAPIQKAKKDREHIRDKARAVEKEAEQREQLAAAKQQADIEGKRRRQANILAAVSVVALVMALVAMFWAFKKQAEAEQTLLKFEIEARERKKLEAQQLVERAKAMRDAGYSQQFEMDLAAALRLDTSAALRREVENLKKISK